MGTSLDDDWNPAAFALFLPVLLNDAALDMTRSATTGRNLRIGGTLRATLPRDATNPRLSIPGRGEEVPSVRAATTEDERPEVLYDRVGTSGAWRLAYERPPVRGTSSAAGPRRVEEVFGVDPDPAEGLLLRADHVAVSGRIPGSPLKVVSAWQDAATTREAARQGEMTSWVLLLVALILLIEPYLAMRFGRHGAPAGDVGGPVPAATAPPPPVG